MHISQTFTKIICNYPQKKNEKDTPAYVAIAVQFDYIKYNVAYDANGGTPKPDSVVNQPYNENFTLAAAPAKTGYTFAKWKASSNSELFGAGSSVNGSSLGLADCHVDGSNVTMTAQWTANTYEVLGAGENCKVSLAAASAAYGKRHREQTAFRSVRASGREGGQG